ncbi:hypothetical protein DM860_011568 [Cuscuta australis]|uniref:Uncharacterized protein n=1 Tax=Cuscuta australis TaxID=267555 RepID=A0A328D017_9ASTE|nr:hypothetical protein DM860_011568 [Cuscuta australis]
MVGCTLRTAARRRVTRESSEDVIDCEVADIDSNVYFAHCLKAPSKPPSTFLIRSSCVAPPYPVDSLPSSIATDKSGSTTCGFLFSSCGRVKMGFWSRGIVPDKWSGRILWVCAIGSAVGMYMVTVERQLQNREKMMAESLAAAEEKS